MRGEVKENVKNELAQEGADVSVEKQQVCDWYMN